MARKKANTDTNRQLALASIRKQGSALAATHGADVDRVCRALEQIVNSLAPELFGDPVVLEHAFLMFPFSLLRDALEYLPQEEAFELIEGSDLPTLARRVSAAEYLAQPNLPLGSVTQLAEWTEKFIAFLVHQRQSLVTSGRPVNAFVPCPYLNGVLGNLYPDTGINMGRAGEKQPVIHRFLFSYPTALGRRVWDESTGVSEQTRETWSKAIDWLFSLQMDDREADSQPRTLRFTDEAAKLWSAWHKRHWDESEWDCFPSHLRGVWSKFEVHALAAVLVAHMLKIGCDHALKDKAYDQNDTPIDADSMRRGLLLADYFKDHNCRVFARLKVSHADLKAEWAIKWIRKRPGMRTSARELQANGVVGIKTSSEAKALLKDLQDRGWGEIAADESGRRRSVFVAA